MGRPFAGDTSHRPIERICEYCGATVLKRPAAYKKAYCSKEHMISHMKANAFRFNCEICAKEVFTQPFQMQARNRRTCSRKCYNVIVRKRAEERRKTYTKHQIDRLARYSKEAEEWRKAIFKRDDYTCKNCGIRSGKGVGPVRLEADHILPFAYFEEYRYELDNGRTLCRPCHDKTKISAKRMREIYTPERVQAIKNKRKELWKLDRAWYLERIQHFKELIDT